MSDAEVQEFNNVIIYKPHSDGKLGTWRIEVALCVGEGAEEGEGQGRAVYTSYAAKVLGGKEKETPTYITVGKQGRTPLEQAYAEAKSKFNTQLRKGYSVDKPKEGDKPKNTLGFNIAVKAQKWQEVDHVPPYTISPKLDGHHISIAVKDGLAVIYSMNSKELDIEHIRIEAQKLYDTGAWRGEELDGELYRHGLELDEIKERIPKKHPEHGLLEFHMYDAMFHNEHYARRFDFVTSLHLSVESSAFQQVETLVVHTLEEVETHHKRWIALNYEGSMQRWGEAGYADSARSKYVLKKKDYQDAEFKVVGHTYGKPKFKEGKEYQVPILIMEAPNGETFKATIHGNMVEKHQAHLDGIANRYGDEYTVKFFKFTAKGVPSQPVGLRWRNDI